MCTSQEGKKVHKRITLIEDYTVENYKMPDSILFYSGGHWEIEKFYNILFDRLKKEFKKSDYYVNYKFDESADIPVKLYSFDELKITFNEDDFNAICVLAIGEIKSEFPNGYINPVRILNYDFYMILVESKTNRVLMKRRYRLAAKNKFYSEHKNLAKEIAKELMK